jgi:hypothetical protein
VGGVAPPCCDHLPSSLKAMDNVAQLVKRQRIMAAEPCGFHRGGSRPRPQRAAGGFVLCSGCGNHP